jgi:hypothetical protein
MSTPNRQTGWGPEENLLSFISKQLEYLTTVAYNNGGVLTDLTITAYPINNVVSNTNGTGFIIPLATNVNAGLLSPDEKTAIANIPTKTSELINDGDNGVTHFISLEDLPANIILYPTTAVSTVPGYYKLVSSITDPSYNTIAVDVPTGEITTTNQLISSLVTTPNIIVGNPGVFNITVIGNITRLSGTGTAEFYFEVYKRTSGGVESLITTSDVTIPVVNTGYSEFSATALWNDGVFLSTDSIVLKFYGSRIPNGSNPSYQFQFGGTSPVRSLVPIPLVVTAQEINNIIISTSTSITTNTNDSLDYGQNGRNVMISNGANAINLTCEISSTTNFVASYTKLGISAITFLAGAGTTLVQVDGSAILNGAVGSTACLTRTANTFYLQISNR